jgi:serine/threonine protein kinase
MHLPTSPAIDPLLHERYRILKSLGSGGFSETFLAKDTLLSDDSLCVVKCLKQSSTEPPPKSPNSGELPGRSPPELGGWGASVKLFETEVQTLYQLGRLTQQIPALLDHFVENHTFYLVQEFIEGQTLSEHIKHKRFNQHEVLDLLRQVLTILQFLHSHQIIHGDVKPRNLIRRQNGHWVLIDFGAVKLASSVASVEAVVIGTAGYMPNEQQAGRSRFSSDIYALGMVAVQCLTGTHPKYWQEDSHTGEIRWNAKLNPQLVKILKKMTRVRSRDRYSSATEVLIDLDKFKQSQRKQHLPDHTFLGGCIALTLLVVITYLQGRYRFPFLELLQVFSLAIPIATGVMLTRLRLW